MFIVGHATHSCVFQPFPTDYPFVGKKIFATQQGQLSPHIMETFVDGCSSHKDPTLAFDFSDYSKLYASSIFKSVRWQNTKIPNTITQFLIQRPVTDGDNKNRNKQLTASTFIDNDSFENTPKRTIGLEALCCLVKVLHYLCRGRQDYINFADIRVPTRFS